VLVLSVCMCQHANLDVVSICMWVYVLVVVCSYILCCVDACASNSP